MTHVFVITESVHLADSISRFFRYTRGIEHIHRIIFSQDIHSEKRVLPVFRQIADAIERGSNEGLGPQELRNAIAIIDLVDANLEKLEDLNPITRGPKRASVVAMLVLAFPEIHWVFVTPHQPINSALFAQAHLLRASNPLAEILALCDGKFTNLFDATNLRNLIRRKMRDVAWQSDQITSHLPLRRALAAAVDEEETYVYFNAYTAYRFGFRSHAVTSYAMMKMLFESSSQAHHEPTLLTFEDIYLNFPDEVPDVHLSNLEKRTEKFGKLEESTYRIIVTVGHRYDQQAWKSNLDYLQNLRSQGKFCNILYKPLAGIFDLWKKSGLRGWLHADRGLGPDFRWPPPRADADDHQGHHSAPGRLLEIADRLIERAERILQSATSVPDAVHGAVLALEAQELLGNKTPTTTLEALALKHELEVTAECMFYGVEYNFDVKTRIKDIQRDVKSIGNWFRSKTRRRSELNAEFGILSELVRIFRQYNQFDEEQECLQQIREVHRHLWFRKHKSWAWIFYPARWYIEYLLGRMHRFVAAIALWIFALGLLFHASEQQSGSWLAKFSGTLVHVFTSFFGLQPPHEMAMHAPDSALNLPLAWAVIFAIAIGFVHLGIFVSHLYSIIARK